MKMKKSTMRGRGPQLISTVKLTPVTAYLSRLAPSSQRTIRKLLRQVVKIIDPKTSVDPGEYPWEKLTYEQTSAFREKLSSRYSPASANLAISALCSVVKEAYRLGWMDQNACFRATDIKRFPRRRVRERPLITAENVDRLLATCTADRSDSGVRDRAVCSLLYYGAIRKIEVVRLNVDDVVSDHVKVRGKGNKWRTCPLPRQAISAIRAWMRLRKRSLRQIPGHPLFVPSSKNGVLVDRRVNVETVAKWVMRRAEQAGMTLACHSLRRARSTHMLEAGYGVPVVKTLLGHSSWVTTSAYDLREEKVHGEDFPGLE